MTRRSRSWALGAALVAAAAGVLRGCGRDEMPVTDPREAGGPPDVQEATDSLHTKDTASEVAPPDGAGGSDLRCATTPAPSSAPEGWLECTLYGGAYRFWYPPTPDLLPDPIVWVDCPTPIPGVSACREIAVSWPSDSANATGGQVFADQDVRERAVFQFRRVYNRGSESARMGIIAEADGRVLQAFWDDFVTTRPDVPYWFMTSGIGGGKSSWRIWHQPSDQYAILAGDYRQIAPRYVAVGGLSPARNYYMTALEIRRWSGDFVAEIPLLGDMTGGWSEDVLYYSDVTLPYASMSVWSEASGHVRLAREAPYSAALATDGQDLAWLEGDTQIDGGAQGAIMTAPFTTIPAELRARRLRAWDVRLASVGSVVGCGYAAFVHSFFLDPAAERNPEYGVLVVRLSDGVAWRLRSPEGAVGDAWVGPTLLTCSELFAVTRNSLRRIRLDSLGPGMPPD